MEKKSIARRLLLYILGAQSLAAGMMLLVRSNLGVSVGTSVYYVLSQRFTALSLGVWNYLAHGFVLILMMIILRKVKLFYLASFLTSMFVGYSMDFYGLLLPEDFHSIVLRIVLLCMGIMGIALGVSLIYVSGLPAAPFDTFSKEISKHFNWKISVVKTAFDITCVSLSVILGMIFFRKTVGIGIGTVISALISGTLVGYFKKMLEESHFIVEEVAQK